MVSSVCDNCRYIYTSRNKYISCTYIHAAYSLFVTTLNPVYTIYMSIHLYRLVCLVTTFATYVYMYIF